MARTYEEPRLPAYPSQPYGGSGTSSDTTSTGDSTTTTGSTVAATPSSPRSKVSEPTGDSSGPTVKAKESDTGASVGVNAWIDVKKIFFKNGDVISCDYAWKEETALKVLREGKALTFELTSVDETKTFL